MASSSHIAILHEPGYKPVELTTVMYKVLSADNPTHYPINPEITTRILREGEEDKWANTSAQGWSTEMDGFSGLMYDFASVMVNSTGAHPFFGEINGNIISTGMLSIYNAVAVFTRASTMPKWRNRVHKMPCSMHD